MLDLYTSIRRRKGDRAGIMEFQKGEGGRGKRIESPPPAGCREQSALVSLKFFNVQAFQVVLFRQRSGAFISAERVKKAIRISVPKHPGGELIG